MRHFIYVFDQEARDWLLEMNYELFKSDDANRVYVFLNREHQDFEQMNISYILSDTLTF